MTDEELSTAQMFDAYALTTKQRTYAARFCSAVIDLAREHIAAGAPDGVGTLPAVVGCAVALRALNELQHTQGIGPRPRPPSPN